MTRLNYMARSKLRTKQPKKTTYQKEQRKMQVILSLIKANKTIKDFEIRKALKLSYNIHYKFMADLQHNYQEFVSWNKKERTFTHLKDYVIEEEIKIKELTDDEVKTIDAIKLEVKI